MSFDDGPDPAQTPQLLDLLAELSLRAHFFLLGASLAAAPEIGRAIAAGGHGIGTHGHAHVHHLVRDPRLAGADLDRALGAFADAGLAPPRFHRPPYGQCSAATLLAARRRGLQTVLWSAWGREFADTDEDRILARLAPRLVPGAIVLLHDADTAAPAGTAARTRRLLPRLAKLLAARGLTTCTLDSLLGAEAP